MQDRTECRRAEGAAGCRCIFLDIPYRRRGIHIISLAVDAPQDVISALSGKLGRLEGVAAKTAYSNYSFPGEADA